MPNAQRPTLRYLLGLAVPVAVVSLLGYLASSAYRGHLEFLRAQGQLQRELLLLQEAVRQDDWNKLQKSAARSGHMAEPVHLGEVVLLRKGSTLGAFIADEQGTDRTQGIRHVQYRWWYRTDGSGRFDEEDTNLHSGAGRAEGTIWLQNKPVKPKDVFVKFGPFKFEWSRAKDEWGWVYYDLEKYDDSPNQFCFTDRTDVAGLDALDPQWRYRRSATDPGWTAEEDKD